MASHRVGPAGPQAGGPAGAGPLPPLAVRRRRWLPLLLPAILITELVAFWLLGELIGFGLTLVLVLVASAAGLVLLRREGLRAWRGFQRAVAAGEPPGPRATDGLVGLAGALLLAFPGLVTTVAGGLLMLPPGRRLARARVQASAERRMPPAAAGEMFGPRRVRVIRDDRPTSEPTDVVEGEIVDDGRQ